MLSNLAFVLAIFLAHWLVNGLLNLVTTLRHHSWLKTPAGLKYRELHAELRPRAALSTLVDVPPSSARR